MSESGTPEQQQQQQQPALRVQDALGYLDQVKSKFNDQPYVYNQFLDIMKEFKSQALDTPGVIAKVSSLFEGHMDLIVGFNTFLPPGFVPSQQPTVMNQSEAERQQQQQPQQQQQQQPQQLVQQLGPGAMQPAEFGFNHALTYVNKIKHRFSANPEIYQQFLKILETYQRESELTKSESETEVPRARMLVESEVYSHVARLFQNQRDLLEEFSQFLPDANGSVSTSGNLNSLTRVHQLSQGSNIANSTQPNMGLRFTNDSSVLMSDEMVPTKRQNSKGGNHHNKISVKRQNNSLGNVNYTSSKRPRMTSLRDVSLAEAGKHGSLNEYAFFDRVRKALKSTDVYENFLRCLVLYNHEIVSRTELVGLANNFIGRFPDLMKWFKEFLGFRDGQQTNASISIEGPDIMSTQAAQNRQRERDRDRMSSEAGVEIDYSSCKRHGASYRGLPPNFVQPQCTGRTTLCREVLNDTLVSFPSWSEDSTFVSSKKTQYEEYIYRCEDERFELDIVIESNLLTIRVLESVKRKIDKMSFDERNRFKLDDTLGGTSCVIHQRAIRRIYGDKAPEIIEGLKKNPVIAVPLVLRRLKAKDEEWRDAQKQFNKIWREQNEKYYLKSLDHQGISFKQNDIKYLRSKSLIKEIEDLQRETQQQDDDLNNASTAGGADMIATTELSNNAGLPHITLVYKENKDMLEEACNLIIHHVKRQTSIHKDEKQRIKRLMRQFIPDLFFCQRGELSDDEVDENDIHEDAMEVDDTNGSEKGYDTNCNDRTGNATSKSTYDNNIPKNSRTTHKSVNNSNINKNINTDAQQPSSPKTITPPSVITSNTPGNRYNRVSPKLSCDESPLKDPELGEPIRPESQQKYLSDIDSPIKDEVIPISLDGRDHPHMEPLTVITDNCRSQSLDPNNCMINQHFSTGSRGDMPSFIKSPSQQVLQNKDPEDNYQIFYIDDKWYCFFRLHHILCQRLGSIYERSKVLIAEELKERKDRRESTAIALRLKPRNDIEVEDYFPVFVDMIKQLLDGNLESNQYEDMLRDMFGIHAYVAFTMDKVVQNLVRQLQHMVGEEVSHQCTELFLEESKNNATGGPCATAQSRANNEANYMKLAEQLLEDENCYKTTIYKNESKLTIALLDTETGSSDNDDCDDGDYCRDSKSKPGKEWFLKRNVKRYIDRESKLASMTGASSHNLTGAASSNTIGSQDDKETSSNTIITGDVSIKSISTTGSQQASAIGAGDSSESDKAGCSLETDQYRRLLVINNDDDHVFFYRHHRPTKKQHVRVTDAKRRKFNDWQSKWIGDNLTDEQIKLGVEWLGDGAKTTSGQSSKANSTSTTTTTPKPHNTNPKTTTDQLSS